MADSVNETRHFAHNQAKGTLRRTSQAPGELVRFRGLGLDGQTSVWTTVGASDLSNLRADAVGAPKIHAFSRHLARSSAASLIGSPRG